MTRVSLLTVLALFSAAYGYPSVADLQDAYIDSFSTQTNSNTRPTHHVIVPRRVSGTQADGVESASHPDLTQVVTRRPFQFSLESTRQEPHQSEEDLQSPRRRRDVTPAASHSAEEDDSDMFLEPDEDSSADTQQTKPSEVVQRFEYGAEPAHADADNDGRAQHFFPSFAPVFSLGHSRPPQLFHQEPQVYKPRSPQLVRAADFNPFRSAYRDSSYQSSGDTEEEASSSGILGSGNFGVIRGGTYYNDDDRNVLNPYYSNGHGRPGYGNPLPQKYNGGDFFANFRDFADINTPTKASFSEFVIVYVNKNGSHSTHSLSDSSRPKNIIEQLSLLDKEDEEADVPEKKISSHKKKLDVFRRQQLEKTRKDSLKKKETVKDFHEPLLALS